MTIPNLRERVARAIEESLYGTERIGRTDTLQYGLEADAAIAIVLEEAAKVADQMQDLHPMDDFDTGWTAGLHECSAAIRALKGKKNG